MLVKESEIMCSLEHSDSFIINPYARTHWERTHIDLRPMKIIKNRQSFSVFHKLPQIFHPDLIRNELTNLRKPKHMTCYNVLQRKVFENPSRSQYNDKFLTESNMVVIHSCKPKGDSWT